MNKKQEKLQQSIVDVTAQIVHEKHLFHIGLRRSNPSYNQIYKIVSNYINEGLFGIKSKYNLEIIPIKSKSSLVLDERIADITKPSIVEYAVFSYSFYIVRGSKRKYTITASGRVTEGSDNKLPDEFLQYYVALLQVVNELLEYATMLAMNQLHHTGLLYIDLALTDLIQAMVKEQVLNDTQDTNENKQFIAFLSRMDEIVNMFIDSNVELYYAINTEAKVPPVFAIDFVTTDNGNNSVELGWIKGKYETIRTVGQPIDQQIVDSCCKFVEAVNDIITKLVKVYKEELIHV